MSKTDKPAWITLEDLLKHQGNMDPEDFEFFTALGKLADRRGPYFTIAALLQIVSTLLYGIRPEDPTQEGLEHFYELAADDITQEWVRSMMGTGPDKLIPILLGLSFTFDGLSKKHRRKNGKGV